MKLKFGEMIEDTHITILRQIHNDSLHKKNVSENQWRQLRNGAKGKNPIFLIPLFSFISPNIKERGSGVEFYSLCDDLVSQAYYLV